MKKKFSFCFLCFFALQFIQSQATIVSGGGEAITSGTVSFTVGQLFYATNTSASHSVSQGIQQSIELFTLSNTDFNSQILVAKAYPNPTKKNAVLSIQNIDLENVTYYLFDIKGRQLLQRQIIDRNTNIRLKNFASGVYLLKVLKNNTLLKVFKIIKN